MFNSKKGMLGVVEVILITIMVAIIGFVIWRVTSNDTADSTQQNELTTESHSELLKNIDYKTILETDNFECPHVSYYACSPIKLSAVAIDSSSVELYTNFVNNLVENNWENDFINRQSPSSLRNPENNVKETAENSLFADEGEDAAADFLLVMLSINTSGQADSVFKRDNQLLHFSLISVHPFAVDSVDSIAGGLAVDLNLNEQDARTIVEYAYSNQKNALVIATSTVD